MNTINLFGRLGVTDSAEIQELNTKLLSNVFERVTMKIVSVGNQNEIETVRNFLTRHTDQDREEFWKLLNKPHCQELLADAWTEEVELLTSDSSVASDDQRHAVYFDLANA